MNNIVPRNGNFIEKAFEGTPISYLTPEEVERLTNAFYGYFYETENKNNKKRSKYRGRYLLFFLFLRYTGARIHELAMVDDKRDLDIRSAEITIPTSKRRIKAKKGKLNRIVSIPEKLVSEYLMLVKLYPDIEGKVFKVAQSNFYTIFAEMCRKAGISKDLAHPHILRHTRAIELLRLGVPITIVQQMLGHASLSTTAIYLRFSPTETKAILKEKGAI